MAVSRPSIVPCVVSAGFVPPRSDGARSLALDVTRGFAIVAMLIAHAAPLLVGLPRPILFLQAQLNDVASALFALCMGAAATVVLGKAGSSGAAAVVLQNVVRGAILVALGLVLAGWGSWIAIVLSFLGVTVALGKPILLLRSRTLIAVIGILLVVGAPLNAAVVASVDPLWRVDPSVLEHVLEWLFLGSSYRVTNLLPFFLAGALLMRAGFGGRRLGAILVATSVPLWAVRWLADRFAGYENVSGAYPDTLHDAGLVAFVVGAVLLLTSVSAEPGRRLIRALSTPLRAIGSLALTLYILQVALVAVIARNPQWYTDLGRGVSWVLIVIAVPVVGVFWWRYVGKGPVEWAIGIVSGRYRLRARSDSSGAAS